MSKIVKKLTTKNYWNKKYKTNIDFKRTLKIHTKINLATTEIDKYLKKILPYQTKYKFIEIGCAPGSWMHYFNSTFGYQPQGIEYTPSGAKLTRKNLIALKLKPIVWQQDLFKNNLKKANFDIVFSNGFIEHFDNPNKAIKEHIKLLKKDGYLILIVPNFSGFNYFIQKHINQDILNKHNTKIMNLKYFYQIATKFKLKIVNISYVGKINFAVFGGNKYKLLPFYGLQFLATIFYKISNGIFFIRDNPKTSPYIIAIFQKIS